MQKIINPFLISLWLVLSLVIHGCTLPWNVTITFDTQGGSPITPLTLAKDEVLEEPVEPTKEGHTFVGWVEQIGDQVLYSFGKSISSSLTLYAKWQVNHYTLRFEDTYGNHLRTITTTYGSIITAPYVSVPLGYHVASWHDADKIVDVSTMPAGDHTVRPTIGVQQFAAAIMEIELDIPIDWVGLDNYEPSRISLTDESGTKTHNTLPALFRGRGNGSWWSYEQKSYRIKFDKKQSLLGEPSSKHWVIIAGAHDFSSMRANSAFTLSKDLFTGIEYTTSVHIIDVYINGDYRGIYSLFEQVRVAEDRIDIESEYGVLDTGYLIEYDSYASGNYGVDYFYVPGLRYSFTMKSPDPEDYHDEIDEETYRAQVSYIQDYMQQVLRAIYDYEFEDLEDLVDIDSMVDMYLLHELYKNTDTGWSSFFLYKKPGGKLYFGPPWDFDFTAGISRGDASPEGLYVAGSAQWLTDFTSSEIYIWLIKHSWFVDRVKARYRELYPQLVTAIPAVFASADRYAQSFGRDAIRWSWHVNWRNDQNYIEQWLMDRNEWMYEWAQTECQYCID